MSMKSRRPRPNTLNVLRTFGSGCPKTDAADLPAPEREGRSGRVSKAKLNQQEKKVAVPKHETYPILFSRTLNADGASGASVFCYGILALFAVSTQTAWAATTLKTVYAGAGSFTWVCPEGATQ